MPEKRYCELCGGEIWGRSHRVRVEGVEMVVCSSCSGLGERVTPARSYRRQPNRPAQRRSGDSVFRRAERRQGPRPVKYDETNLELMDGYGALLRRIRNKQKMTQKELADKLKIKESLVKKLELEQVKPPIRLAQRIERTFQVKMLKEVDEDEDALPEREKPRKIGAPTLGDMVVFKKRKKG
ncbi:MAG: multiprotein bridging factor aMBF1 [Promethearchaeota archaeon]